MEEDPEHPMPQEDPEAMTSPLHKGTSFDPTPSFYVIVSYVLTMFPWPGPPRPTLNNFTQILKIKLSDSLDSIITSIPELSLEPLPSPSLDSFPSKKEGEISPYNLRPRDKKDNLLEVFGGLGNSVDPQPGPKQSWKKSSPNESKTGYCRWQVEAFNRGT